MFGDVEGLHQEPLACFIPRIKPFSSARLEPVALACPQRPDRP
jgi:hypothetical protein